MTGLVSSEEIAPGASAEIVLTLDPVGKFGNVDKSMSIHSSDPFNPQLDVPVRAIVEHGIEEGSAESLEEVLFGRDECVECHATPAGDLQGADLYAAVCEMCHGQLWEYSAAIPADVTDEAALRTWIADGDSSVGMPGFSSAKGGPLTPEQVESLVEAIGDMAEQR